MLSHSDRRSTLRWAKNEKPPRSLANAAAPVELSLSLADALRRARPMPQGSRRAWLR
jgi:hypothetical protein